MKRTNLVLLCLVVLLGIASFLAYRHGTTKADRFERGQQFLQNLNTDEVATIVIRSQEKETTLTRRGDEFVVQEYNGYPAANDAVNRLFKKLMEIGLEREVGEGESLEEELGFIEGADTMTEAVLKDSSDNVMVRIRIGKSVEMSGNYIQRLDKGSRLILQSESGIALDAHADPYLARDLVDVDPSEISRIEGRDFVLVPEEGGILHLQDIPAGKKEKSSEVGKMRGALTRLVFSKPYLADAPEVQDLAFERILNVDLKDGSGYELLMAIRDEKRYLQIRGFHAVERVEIARDTPEDELREKAEMLSRSDEMKAFDAIHGSWVYELTEYVGAKFDLTRADMLENAE